MKQGKTFLNKTIMCIICCIYTVNNTAEIVNTPLCDNYCVDCNSERAVPKIVYNGKQFPMIKQKDKKYLSQADSLLSFYIESKLEIIDNPLTECDISYRIPLQITITNKGDICKVAISDTILHSIINSTSMERLLIANLTEWLQELYIIPASNSKGENIYFRYQGILIMRPFGQNTIGKQFAKNHKFVYNCLNKTYIITQDDKSD